MVKKRNRKSDNRSRKRADKQLKTPQTMAAPFRFKCPNVFDCLRRFCIVIWSRRSAFFAITGLFGFLAVTFRKREENRGVGEPETNNEKSETLEGIIPERIIPEEEEEEDEPLTTVLCPDETPGREPAAEEDEGEEEECDVRDDRVDVTDELYCDYDSTWETNYERTSETNRVSLRPRVSSYKFGRFKNAARDMQEYRHNYPSKRSTRMWRQQGDKPNLKFYQGLRTSAPDEVHIKDFHNHWYGRYDQLEYVHTYIQWLFPLQEPGVNSEATPLTKEEIEDFLQDSTAKSNLLESYKLMLDFYGIQLWDEKTGEVKRARNWRERFLNMDSNTHNNLRITRILKCLGTLGFAHYQAPLVRFFLEETLVYGQLQNVKDSVLNYFVFAVLDKTKRRSLIKFAYLHYDPKDEFVWCPKKMQSMWSLPSRRDEMITDDDTEDD